MKPIHKFNNGRGATLCHSCSVIISEGMTKDLYCEKCRPKQETTLEEAAERIYTTELVMDVDISEDLQSAFINGVKWQQEPEQFFNDDRVKTLEKGIEYLLKRQERMYSEEEVLELLEKIQQQVAIDYNDEFLFAKEWFEQFKKK